MLMMKMYNIGKDTDMNVSEKDNNIYITQISDFNVEQTLECGQCFHFKKLGENEYALAAFGKLLHIMQEKDRIILFDTDMKDYNNIWKKYFDLGRDYKHIKDYILKNDKRLKEAVETMGGVRILNQDFFETLISFIISQNKQIPHIKKIVFDISKRYGRYLGSINGEEFYSFPDVEAMKNVTEAQLRECKTGFRAPYIADAVKKVASGEIRKDGLLQADIKECEKMLMSIKGVGTKVANCVMLFSLGKTDAFPVDVWIKRIMEYIYFDGADTKKEIIEQFARKHFGEYGGFAQQYLFYYAKTMKIGTDTSGSK